MHERIIPFEAILNFRDFGGYETADGGRVREGVLYRSANLNRATEADHARLRQMAIAVSTDLRRAGEREAEPARWPADATPRIISETDAAFEDLPPHMRFLRDAERLDAEAVHGYMIQTYKRIPFEDRHIAMFSQAFEALAAGETPIHVHCAAGKDRTGVLCALILGSLGVSDDDVRADYLITNAAIQIDSFLLHAADRFAHKLGREIEPAALAPMVGVHLSYLDSAYDEIAARAGSPEAYVREVLGVSPATIVAMRDRLLEPSAEPVQPQ